MLQKRHDQKYRIVIINQRWKKSGEVTAQVIHDWMCED
jgi:hypothetical protein